MLKRSFTHPAKSAADKKPDQTPERSGAADTATASRVILSPAAGGSKHPGSTGRRAPHIPSASPVPVYKRVLVPPERGRVRLCVSHLFPNSRVHPDGPSPASSEPLVLFCQLQTSGFSPFGV